MSPFAMLLRELRVRRGLKQKDAAYLLGYEPSYLSALERSTKGPPRKEFITRLVRAMRLNDAEQESLAQALHQSKRQVSLPGAASCEEYALVRELEVQLGHLHPVQIQLIRQALSLPDAFGCPRKERAMT